MSKLKCQEQHMLALLLELEVSRSRGPLWRDAHLEVKRVKNCRSQATFGSCDVEKVHGAVARITFGSEKCHNTILGPLLEVAMSKKCMPLWRKTHFEVKSLEHTSASDRF